MIKAEGLFWKYSAGVILKGVTFEIPKGKVTSFVGPSGAGKTTLLRCISGLHGDFKGTLTCDGMNLFMMNSKERVSTIGFVLQQFHLFSNLTVLQNCIFPMIAVQKKLSHEAEKDAMEVLVSLGIGHLWNESTVRLSGGQQQRVAIARALVLQPKILLFDEPTSALDPERKNSITELFLRLNAEGVTIAVSTHDMPFVKGVADRIYFMEYGEITETFDRDTDFLSSKPKISKYLGV
jgi:ABC-type polar amino acid transport system ATPase subunit